MNQTAPATVLCPLNIDHIVLKKKIHQHLRRKHDVRGVHAGIYGGVFDEEVFNIEEDWCDETQVPAMVNKDVYFRSIHNK